MAATSAPNPPGPREPHRLSDRERALLAQIEDDLTGADPALARNLDRAAAGLAARSPISVSQGGLLVVALLILIVAATLIPASWWAVLALLTTLLVVPWILLSPSNGTPRTRPTRRAARAPTDPQSTPQLFMLSTSPDLRGLPAASSKEPTIGLFSDV